MDTLTINRAPVLTLWASVVAERLGFERDEALTLGKAVAGLTAQSKGQRLGIFTPSPEAVRRQRAEKAKKAGVFPVALLGRAVPVLHTEDGLRAVGKDQKPVSPASVQKYLTSKFGEALPAVRAAMEKLAKSRDPDSLAAEGFRLYEAFRPSVTAGESGWGAKGTLRVSQIVALIGKS
jgi:hypothetical protein